MSRYKSNTILAAVVTLAGTALAGTTLAGAAESPPLAKDLTSVIALLGLPCGEVVSVVHKGDNDNIATCKDGHRYHVFLNADGRVVAQKQ
jgi:hypothetical protein